MKQTAKRILAFVSVVCIAFLGIVTMPFVQVNAAAGDWNLVTDASTLAAGDQVIIAAKDYNYALSTTQNSNNRKQAAITKNGNTATFGDDVQVLTLEAGTVSGTFAFNTGNGYLYAASSSSNYLRTQPTNNENGSWKIEIAAATGVATVKAQGTFTRNVLQYNQGSSLFACYAEDKPQKAICLYKLEVDESQPTITLDGANYTVVGGEDITLTATTENVTEDIVWTSGNDNIATVEGGVVKAVGMGKVTITAAANGVEATKDIIVYPAADSELTIAQALQVCELTGTTNAPYDYSTTGVITEVTYNETHSNYTAIITDGTNSIKAYGMTKDPESESETEPTVGMKIKVTGSLITYGSTPEFNTGCTYVEIVDKDLEDIKAALNAVNAWMSLGYKYTQETVENEISATDEIVFELGEDTEGTHKETTTSKTTYTETVGDYTLSITGGEKFYPNSNDEKGNSCIKLGTGSATASFSFTVPNDVTKVIFAVAGYKANTANITVNSTGYEIKTKSNDGTYTDVEVDTSNNKAITFATNATPDERAMINTITFVVENENGGGTEKVKTFSDVDFRLQCGVDATLADIEGVDGYGIRVTANGKTVDYNSDSTSWNDTDETGKIYVLLKLGDVLNNFERVTADFTVQAYVVVDGITYVSTSVKEYSVASMIKEYKTKGYDVSHLYNILVEKGAITEEVA